MISNLVHIDLVIQRKTSMLIYSLNYETIQMRVSIGYIIERGNYIYGGFTLIDLRDRRWPKTQAPK